MKPTGQHKTFVLLLALLLLALSGCGTRKDDRRVITLWHQMTPAERVVLAERIAAFEETHPDIHVRSLYKETEELRSGFQNAVLANSGPELIFGPSDVLGPFHTMGIVQDMSGWLPEEERKLFDERALTWLPARDDPNRWELVQIGDRFGNHLALVYNRKFVAEPPKTTDELIELAKANTTMSGKSGRRYGLVWNNTEPFFAIPFLTGYDAWVFDDSGKPVPSLDTPEAAEAYAFIRSLQATHHVVPPSCDYETADSLFKNGQAAMLINGEWSWADYLNNEKIDAAIAPLPIVSATGKPMAPMIAPRGYSLNVVTEGEQAEAAMAFVRFMIGDQSQRIFLRKLRIVPSRLAVREDPFLREDPTLQASLRQIENGRLMPVDAELRAIWDSMRPHYQGLLAGNVSPHAAAKAMQRDAERAIALMHRDAARMTSSTDAQSERDPSVPVLAVLAGLLTFGLLFWQRRSFTNFFRNWRRDRLAYCFVLPAFVVIFSTIVFPFVFNVVLSLSNMSLAHFRDWQIVGVQNYVDVVTEQEITDRPDGEVRHNRFLGVFWKTTLWTVINVVFHVGLGVLLAVALNGPIRGKAIYRVLLIIPWAVPAFITALTWRGMFNNEFGAVNLVLGKLHILDAVNWLLPKADQIPQLPDWLHQENSAFAACIITNIWLGVPFMMVIALGGLQGIPQELYEAARIDRATRWQQFRHVTLPLLKPVLIPATTLGVIWTFNNLNVIWLVSNGGEPSDQTHILVSYVYKAVFNLYRYGYGAALSMVIFAILLVFSLVFLRKTEATEAVY